MKSVKGQVWSADIITASIIFLIIMLLFIISWNQIGYNWDNSLNQDKLYVAALFASDSIISKSGGDWETQGDLESASSFGLVDERNKLNNRKLEALQTANLTIVRQKLGVEQYNLFINITNESTSYYQIGSVPDEFNKTVVMERLAILNESIVKVRIYLWE